MVNHRAFCTLFDSNYLAKGLAMIASLRRADPGASMHVLCLDAAARIVIQRLAWPGLFAMELAALEAADSKLALVRTDGRSTIEYYFTLKPSIIQAVMAADPNANIVTYVDGDLWFTDSLAPLFDEMQRYCVLLTPHRFAAAHRARAQYGLYNAGWVSFRRSEDGIACLNWWYRHVLEWCGDHVDEANDRFADQRYLDRMARQFPCVRVTENPGANVAPWNAAASTFERRDGQLYIDGQSRLLFFHFHGVQALAPRLFGTANSYYGEPLRHTARRNLYRPYLREVIAMQKLADSLAPPAKTADLRPASWGSPRLRSRISRIIKGVAKGALVYVY